MGKVGEQLFFKLRPIASGNDRHFDDTEKVMQQCRHIGVKRRFTFGKRTVQIKNNQLFHYSPTPEFLRSQPEFPTPRSIPWLRSRIILVALSPTSSQHCTAGKHTLRPPPARATPHPSRWHKWRRCARRDLRPQCIPARAAHPRRRQ